MEGSRWRRGGGGRASPASGPPAEVGQQRGASVRGARPRPVLAGAPALRWGLGVPTSTPPSRTSPAAAAAHARGLAQGGGRRRARGSEPVRPAEPAWSCGRCRARELGLPLLRLRAERGDPATPRLPGAWGDERRPRGCAPGRRAPPLGGAPGAPEPALRPPPPAPGLRNLWARMGRL